ncbi:MAG: bifunctional methylenetetrahydrofolate dehydrogenase/methenyltetrahydrofolate cyclohydrolase FolD [Alphaproteobacteria bacterium]|jgi:methylenetetrahydrofolate dehydrogenase (NADP+)/methenyltetrahydrofolate cyclohydrolase
MPEIIYGSLIAEKCRTETAEKTAHLKKRTGKAPRLDVIIAGDNPASRIYVRNKEKAAANTGIVSIVHALPVETPRENLLQRIAELNENPEVNGILVQLPLPNPEDEKIVTQAVSPDKDVDGFHPLNLGRLMLREDGFTPCTPRGCMRLIHSVLPDISGLNAVVIGRSTIVGKPMAQLLLNADATVTTTHSKTTDLPSVCRRADILVAAVGIPRFVKAGWVRDGAVVIDVGINRLENGTLCGDVDFEAVLPKCRAITPVPKGVGPMTIAMLMENTVEAFCRQNGIDPAQRTNPSL